MAKYDAWITEEGLLRIEGWARDGLSEKQIAEEKLNVAYSTLKDWKKKFPAFSAAIKRGKDVSDRMVENALFKRAVGYSYDEETYKIVNVKEKRTEEKNGKKVVIEVPVQKEILVKRITKHVSPDTGAAAFWLKNRKPDVWRDKKETELTGKVELDVDTKKKLASEFMNDLVGDDLNE